MSAAAQVFVYYRIRPEAREEASRRVAALLRKVELETGVAGRLLCRLDEPELWMEVYEPVRDADAFFLALDTALAAMDLAPLMAPGATRKVERFRDVGPCA